ncbi:hypothetical protein AAE478_002123 [Parahypoxylon ruwenzoriense]
MASVPYDCIAASKPFRFLVGPDKKEFMMHIELVARLSKPLHTLVKGDMKEAQEGVAEWPEIDEGTFIRFCEFAYTGSYKAAVPASAESDPELESKANGSVEVGLEPEIDPVGYDEPSGYSPPASRRKKYRNGYYVDDTPTKKDEMWTKFKEDEAGEENPNTEPTADFSEVLLSHARLYALADLYDIDTLMTLCVRKLHRTLKAFNLHNGARATDVAQLIDYSYKNTISKQGKQDKLRNLLATYAACKIEELWSNLYFKDVLESGDVSKSIVEQLLRRLD